jgi:hypothetical protein
MAQASGRVMFDNLEAATRGLKVTLEYARTCEETFHFGPLTAQQILASGLALRGSTNKIRGMLEDVPGASWYAD